MTKIASGRSYSARRSTRSVKDKKTGVLVVAGMLMLAVKQPTR